MEFDYEYQRDIRGTINALQRSVPRLLRIGSSSFSEYHCFVGFDPNNKEDEMMGIDVPSGPFEVKIQQISTRKRSRNGKFPQSSRPARPNYLERAGGGLFNPSNPWIIFNEETKLEKKCAQMAADGAGIEFTDELYDRLGMESLRRKAVAQAKQHRANREAEEGYQ